MLLTEITFKFSDLQAAKICYCGCRHLLNSILFGMCCAFPFLNAHIVKWYQFGRDLISPRSIFLYPNPSLTRLSFILETFELTSTKEIQHVALLFLLAFLLLRHAPFGISKTYLTFFLDTCSFYLVWPASFPSYPQLLRLSRPSELQTPHQVL